MFSTGELIKNINNIKLSSPYDDLWEKIPYEIKELLWFTNEKPLYLNHTGITTIELSFRPGANIKDHVPYDPSTIYFRLPIKTVEDFSLIEKLPYTPSYAKMTPEQRFIYLTWLQDISREIDIGYRFLFYYGLERRLLIGDHEKASDMIARLRSGTENASFKSYSANSLLFGAIKSDDVMQFEKLRLLFDDEVWVDIQVIAKIFLKEPIEAYEIPRILKAYSVNKRYLNEKIYVEEMRQLLSEKYGGSFFSRGITSDDVKYSKQRPVVFANVSFPEHIRVCYDINLPEIDEPLAIIKDLHTECHERTKKRLKEIRKL